MLVLAFFTSMMTHLVVIFDLECIDVAAGMLFQPAQGTGVPSPAPPASLVVICPGVIGEKPYLPAEGYA